MPPVPGAAALDADDLLLRVFSSMLIADRVRLGLVCKRWASLLLSEVILPLPLARHAPSLVLRAGASLRVLDISSLRTTTRAVSGKVLLEDLMYALQNSGAGSSIGQLVMWRQELDCCGSDWDRGYLQEKQVEQLRAACPRLTDDTRCYLRAHGAESAAAMLDAIPGRHALVLGPPLGK